MKRINFKIKNQQNVQTLTKNKNTIEVKKEVKPTYTIIEEQLTHSGYERGYQNWHKHVMYTCKETEARIKISDSIAGCAVQHLYGWYNYENREGIIETLKYCIKHLDEGVGFVTCQVGATFQDSLLVKGLLELGFVDNQYSNYQHNCSGTEIGHFYTLTIKKK